MAALPCGPDGRKFIVSIVDCPSPRNSKMKSLIRRRKIIEAKRRRTLKPRRPDEIALIPLNIC